MADECIKREEAVELADDILHMIDVFRSCNAIDYHAYSELFDMLCGFETIPVADVRHVVLCKECRWWEKHVDSCQERCALLGLYPTGGFFCGNGMQEVDNG